MQILDPACALEILKFLGSLSQLRGSEACRLWTVGSLGVAIL